MSYAKGEKKGQIMIIYFWYIKEAFPTFFTSCSPRRNQINFLGVDEIVK